MVYARESGPVVTEGLASPYPVLVLAADLFSVPPLEAELREQDQAAAIQSVIALWTKVLDLPISQRYGAAEHHRD